MREVLKGMLEGKYYESLDMVSHFVTGFIYWCTGYNDGGTLTELNTRYSDLVDKVLVQFLIPGCTDADILLVEQ